MRPPAFQFYVDDFIAGTMNMTDAEVGLYMRLLCVQWSKGCISPTDSELVSYGRGRTPLARVKAKFKLCDDGMLRNERLEQEREKQAEWRRKSALGGMRSGEIRSKGGSRVVQPPYEPNGNTPVSGLQSPVSNKDIGRSAGAAPTAFSVDDLKSNPAYSGINIDQERGKAEAWCMANKKVLTMRRFVNWLNRCDRPLGNTPPPKRPSIECPGWKTILNHEFPESIYSAGQKNEAHEWTDLPPEAQQLCWQTYKKQGAA